MAGPDPAKTNQLHGSFFARPGITRSVPEVWIADLGGAAVEVCLKPEEGAYTFREKRAEGPLAPALVPNADIDIGALFA